jgi:hypothetical protein
VKDPNFNDIWSVKPLDYPVGSNFHKKDDSNRFDSGDNWKQYAIWTTERYNRRQEQPVYHHRGYFNLFYINYKTITFILDQYDDHPKPPPNYVPYQIHHERHHQSWQPCNCKQYPGPFINPQQPPSANIYHKVDDKLEKPFSKTS